VIWHALTHYWFRHDLFFTRFGLFREWVRWNLRHFRFLDDIREWHGWQALWSWVNIHG
jgi:hypothetical protein